MPVDFRTLDDFEHIPEEEIASRYEFTKSPALKHMLDTAQAWRDADCTPVFIIYSEGVIGCVAEETFGRKPS